MACRFQVMGLYAGWIDGTLECGGDSHFFSYSYLTNFFDDLMKALLYVDGHWPQDERVDAFRAECEPAVQDWMLQKEGDSLTIRIVTYDSEYSKEIKKTQTFFVSYQEFLGAFIQGMREMLQKYGLYGYRREWQSAEFPMGLFVKLVAVYRGEDAGILHVVTAEENFGTEVQASDLEQELELLRQ